VKTDSELTDENAKAENDRAAYHLIKTLLERLIYLQLSYTKLFMNLRKEDIELKLK